MTTRVLTKADEEVFKCLTAKESFAVIAGAGAGKTSSLVEALRSLVKIDGARMLRDGQRAVCITYTKRAVGVITDRLRQNPLFLVSTLHSFLWHEIGHFPKSIRESLRRCILPYHIDKQKEKDSGGKSKVAIEARAKIADLEQSLVKLDSVLEFRYGDDTNFSNYLKGEIGHDDLVLLAADMIRSNRALCRILAQKYPYIFIDEAQDTSPEIIAAFNSLCAKKGLPIVGYFGDPMQQIYDKGNGDFSGPVGAKVITKEENFRSAPAVISLLNAFRKDVTQIAAGRNSSIEGSVYIILAKGEVPEAPRARYSEVQLNRARLRLADAIEFWGWTQNTHAKQLFLARRMIARRLGFLALHDLFDGEYASSRAKSAYEEGEHFLLKPVVETIVPLVRARREGNTGALMRVLTGNTAAFRTGGLYSEKVIREVRQIANQVTAVLADLFASKTLGDVLRYCRSQGLIKASDRLNNHLDRPSRDEAYDEEKHVQEKEDWLSDAYFQLTGAEVEKYCDFLNENTPYSTQHGVKGEEYEDVIVVFDDVEAAWNNYSFAKMLVPQIAGEPKDTQKERSRKLAYVCFSRAVRNLRILLFTSEPYLAKRELATQGLFLESQISILGDPG